MKDFPLKKVKFVPLHILFWVGVWFFFIYFFSYNSDNSTYVFWFSSFLLPVTLSTTYFTVYFLIPKYLLLKKYWLFALYGTYTLILSTYVILLSIFGNFIFLTNLKITNIPLMSRNYVFVLILVYLIVGLVSFVKLLKHSFETSAKNTALENKLLESSLHLKEQELHYLKKQIHPHFLFNTLNTIYGFSLRKAEETPELILKLSNLLDYILYQVQKPKVSLSDEIDHIKEYISLEKIRFQDTLNVSFETKNIDQTIEIPPMLFIPFVENTFKHGAIIDGYLTIEIQIETNKEQLIFRSKNSYREKNDEIAPNGLGLESIQKRLELLFGENYNLETNTNGEAYIVELTINLQ
jgi:two-component system LytT family sensor kinase